MRLIRGQHLPIAVIAASFSILATIYSLTTPVFEASDEISHYPVVQYIATHWQLPIQRPGVETMWEQEGSQPPLYYLISAALTSWIDTSDLPQIRDRNPHAKLGIPLDQDNKNMILHTEAENFPWKGTVLAIHMLRFFGIALGVCTAILTYMLALEVWPEPGLIAPLAACFVALNPMFLFITGSVNNDNLIIPLSTWALLLICRSIQSGQTLRRTVTLSVVLALAALTKLSGLTLLPVAGLMLVVTGWRARQWRRTLLSAVIIIAVLVAIAGWWYLRNLQLYHELTGMNMQITIAKGRQIALWDLLRNESYGFWISYWALFGAVNILADPAVYWLYGTLSAAGIAGLILWLMVQLRQRDWNALIVPGVLIVQVLITLVGLVRWTLMTYASQGRLIFPVIAVLSLFMSRGIVTLLPIRARLPVAAATACLLFGVAVVAPFRYVAPTYADPPVVVSIPPDAIPVGANFGPIELIAAEAPLSTVREHAWIPITLYWRANQSTTTNYSLFLHALGSDNQEIGKIDSYPGGGKLPTSRMPPGEIIKDEYSIPVSAHIQSPSRIRVLIGMGLYQPNQYTVIPATRSDGTSYGTIGLDAGVVYPLDLRDCQDIHPADAVLIGSLGGFAELRAERLDQSFSPGEQIPVVLYWNGLNGTDVNWTVFVHLVDQGGKIITQADSPPLNNDYPTTLWRLPCEVRDVHILQLPASLASGHYTVLVGLYNASDPAYPRAQAVDAGGSPYPNNAVPVETIRVEAQ